MTLCYLIINLEDDGTPELLVGNRPTRSIKNY